jgi:hypothetical protein
MNAKSRKSPPVRIREPHLLGFILVATLVIVAGVVSIGVTGDAWLVALVVAVMLALAAVLALDVGFAIDTEEEALPAPAPAGAAESAAVDTTLAPSSDFTGSRTRRHVIVLTSHPVPAPALIEMLGSLDGLEVMVVSPEGFGHREITDDESNSASARRAEEITVASLRRTGIPAAGHVGDHDPIQAIEDARMLCGAERAVVVTHRDVAGAYHAAVAQAVRTGRIAEPPEIVDVGLARA